MYANIAHAHCMLDNLVYKYAPRICNTYCFFTAERIAQPRLGVTLYIQCLSCYILHVEASSYFLEVTEYFVVMFVYMNSLLKVYYIYKG